MAGKIVGVALIVLGALALIWGGFSFTHEDTKAQVGPVELSVQEKEHVNIPLWAGIGAIAVGGLLVVVGERRT